MTKLSTICYLDNGSEILLLHRNKKPNDIHEGKWISVGGKFEAGETPEECAIREIKEETGLTATKLDLRGFITFTFSYIMVKIGIVLLYVVTEFEGEIFEECDEGTLEWVPYDQVMAKPTWEGDYIYLDWLVKQTPYFSAKFPHDTNGELTVTVRI